MIIARNLLKKFGDFKALDHLNLDIKQGECFGLLGPNGAGKSTFISLLYGQSKRTGGELKVLGHDPDQNLYEIKKNIGIVTQENALDESLNVFENMLLYASFVGIPATHRASRVEELLKDMELWHKKSAMIQTLSGGMKRRLAFVRALLGNPTLLILDEPTTGLDPSVRHSLWKKVKELKDKGVTILLTTHYMHEAEVLCDRLVILNKGLVVAHGSPRELIQKYVAGFIGIYLLVELNLKKKLLADSRFFTHEDYENIHIRAESLDELMTIQQEYGLTPLQVRPSNLEDVFLKLTGKELSCDD